MEPGWTWFVLARALAPRSLFIILLLARNLADIGRASQILREGRIFLITDERF